MKLNKCLGCMEPFQGYPCPRCGFDPKSVKAAEYALPMVTILSGKYLVGRVLGQGGFGITYIGWDIALERKVAIKEYFPSGQVSRNPGTRDLTWYTSEQSQQARQDGMQMFLKEARKMSKVDDIPNVVRVRDLFQENGTAYIVMDFVEGETLKARLQRIGPMSWEQAKEIFLPAIQAMEQVHKAGLVHRDLSPDNLMLTPEGKVMILDLGAAKDLSINSGASSMQVAKGGFSPLEQYTQRGTSGPWTDVYSMAATIYYTLTGELLPNAVDRVEEDPLNWTISTLQAMPKPTLETLKNAMALSVKKRMQSMAELEKGLFETAERSEAKPEFQPTPQPASQIQSEFKPEAGQKSGEKIWIAVAAVIAAVICGMLIWMNDTMSASDDTGTAVLAATTPTAIPTTIATVAEETFPLTMYSGLNMTQEEFEQEFLLLFDAAKSWTKETAPQNIREFPIFPESLIELLDTLENAQSEIEITDSTLTWKSNPVELLPKARAGVGTIERSFGYLDQDNKSWSYARFMSVGDYTYTAPTTVDAWADNSSPTMYFLWYTYLGEWCEYIQAAYEISNQCVVQMPYVCLRLSNEEYSIEWGQNIWDQNNYTIYISSNTAETPTTSALLNLNLA